MTITKEIMDRAEAALKEIGIEHFIVMIPPDDNLKLTVLYHDMPASQTMNLFINGLFQAIDHELGANPSYSKKYAKIFTDFKQQFKECVATVNTKVAKYNQKTEEK